MTDTSDQSTQSVDVELKITAPSNINFGNTQSSAFVVDPVFVQTLQQTSPAMQRLQTRLRSQFKPIRRKLGMDVDDVDGTNARLQLGPNTMDFVRIWVDVPDVIDGAPLANQGPTFRLVALDLMARKLHGDFSLEVSSFLEM